MISWIVTRGGRVLFVCVGVSFIMFLLLFLAPNPVELLKKNPEFSEADVERISAQYGWDQPWYRQYYNWASGFVRGDWGVSTESHLPARDLIVPRIPLTLMLTTSSQLIALLTAIPLGAFLAVNKGSPTDRGAALMAASMMAIPTFFIAILFQVFALKFAQSAGVGFISAGGPPLDHSAAEYARRLFLPVLTLALVLIASWSRYQRSEMLEILDRDHIQAARAKGLPARHIHIRHALRATLLPVTTIVAIDVAALFTGAVFVEEVFGLPGVGALLLDSVAARDVVVCLDIIVLAALFMVIANIAADSLYGRLDARIGVS